MLTVEQRLTQLESIQAISILKADYCDACDDDHNGDAVAKLFCDDGIWEFAGRPQVAGKTAIAAYMYSIRDAGAMACSAHLLSNPRITVNGDHAHGSWRFVMLYTSSDGHSFYRIIGRYQDSFIRQDGNWRFKSLLATVEERGAYQAQSEQN